MHHQPLVLLCTHIRYCNQVPTKVASLVGGMSAALLYCIIARVPCFDQCCPDGLLLCLHLLMLVACWPGLGLSRAVAGKPATFLITARDEQNNPRLSGGDVFSVLLLPQTASAASGRSTMTTGAATPLAVVGQSECLNEARPSANTAAAVTASSVVQLGTLAAACGSNGSGIMTQQVEAGEGGGEAEHQVVLVPAVAVGDVQDCGDGTYTCSYTHTKAGQYDLHVVNGEAPPVEPCACFWVAFRLQPPPAAAGTETVLRWL